MKQALFELLQAHARSFLGELDPTALADDDVAPNPALQLLRNRSAQRTARASTRAPAVLRAHLLPEGHVRQSPPRSHLRDHLLGKRSKETPECLHRRNSDDTIGSTLALATVRKAHSPHTPDSEMRSRALGFRARNLTIFVPPVPGRGHQEWRLSHSAPQVYAEGA